jgi:hypothetical protein
MQEQGNLMQLDAKLEADLDHDEDFNLDLIEDSSLNSSSMPARTFEGTRDDEDGTALEVMENDIQFSLNAEVLQDKEDVNALPLVITPNADYIKPGLLQIASNTSDLGLLAQSRLNSFQQRLQSQDKCVRDTMQEIARDNEVEQDVDTMLEAQTKCAEAQLELLNSHRAEWESKYKQAQKTFKEDKTKVKQCYLTMLQVEASKVSQPMDNSGERHVPTREENADRYSQQAKFDAAQSNIMKGINGKWHAAEQAWEQYEKEISDLESQVNWLPSMKNALISFLMKSLPSTDCMIFNSHCPGEEELSVEEATAKQRDARDPGENSFEWDTRRILTGFLPAATPRNLLRTNAASQLDLHVKGPLMDRVSSLMGKAWDTVDMFVNPLISVLSSLVGSVPFVGGVLATIVTMALMFVYGQIKAVVDGLVEGLVESVINFFIDEVLDFSFGPVEYRWTQRGINTIKLLPEFGYFLKNADDTEAKAGDKLTEDQIGVLETHPGGLTNAIFPEDLIECVPLEGDDMLSKATNGMADDTLRDTGRNTRGIRTYTGKSYNTHEVGSRVLGEADYHEDQVGAYCAGDTISLSGITIPTVQECANQVATDARCDVKFMANPEEKLANSCHCVPKGGACEEVQQADHLSIYVLDDDQFRESWLEGLPAWFDEAAAGFGMDYDWHGKKDLLEQMNKVPHPCGADIAVKEQGTCGIRFQAEVALTLGKCMNKAIKAMLEDPPDTSVNTFSFTPYTNVHSVEDQGQAATSATGELVPLEAHTHNCILYKCQKKGDSDELALQTQKDEGWTVYSTTCDAPPNDEQLLLFQKGDKQQIGSRDVPVPSAADLKRLLEFGVSKDADEDSAEDSEDWKKLRENARKKSEENQLSSKVSGFAKMTDPDPDAWKKSSAKLKEEATKGTAQSQVSTDQMKDVAISQAEEARDREAKRSDMKAETIQDISNDYSEAMGGVAV